MDQDKKRELRQLKREIKRKGGKVRRRQLKQGLAENPEEAHLTEVDFGRFQSSTLNGLDRHQTWQGGQPGEQPPAAAPRDVPAEELLKGFLGERGLRPPARPQPPKKAGWADED